MKQNQVNEVINCTVKMDTTMRAFEQEGGKKMFEKNMARGLGVSKDNVRVKDVR